ncbi:MAG: hypothetical protein U9O56_07640 [Campylobacterota bacterium]|nr:hypothetical protein [Campylobacterota bacterium]
MKKLYFLVFIVVLFSACSSKQYYEPKDVDSDYDKSVRYLDSDIKETTPYGLTLENNNMISKNGIVDINYSGFNFLNDNNNTILAADLDNTVLVKNENSINKYKFKKDIIAASIKKNLLAMVSIDNSISLFDTDTKEVRFKEYFKKSSINDIKIAAPMFLSTVILYPTLDGKVSVFDIKSNKIVKTINIDPSNDINNIIFLGAIGDTLVAATNNKLFSFAKNKINVKDFDITNVLINNNKIFITTLDGRVIKFDEELNIIKSKKFKYAKFYILAGINDNIYTLESQDFLIKMDNNLENETIYNFSFDENENVKVINNKLYFEDEYITLD